MSTEPNTIIDGRDIEFFYSSLTSLKTVNKDEDIAKELTLSFTVRSTDLNEFISKIEKHEDKKSESVSQGLLYPTWSSAKFNTDIRLHNMAFNDIIVPGAILKEVKVSKKVFDEDMIFFKFNLVIRANINTESDNVLNYFLKRKEPDENGKLSIAEYPTVLWNN